MLAGSSEFPLIVKLFSPHAAGTGTSNVIAGGDLSTFTVCVTSF